MDWSTAYLETKGSTDNRDSSLTEIRIYTVENWLNWNIFFLFFCLLKGIIMYLMLSFAPFYILFLGFSIFEIRIYRRKRNWFQWIDFFRIKRTLLRCTNIIANILTYLILWESFRRYWLNNSSINTSTNSTLNMTLSSSNWFR